VLEWLGRRYAERCDLETSQMYFRRARDLRYPVHVPSDIGGMYKARGDTYDDSAFLRNVSKAPVRAYARNNELDREQIEYRADCAWPNGAHVGSDTFIYALPPQGWTHGIHGQETRREMLGLTLRLPSKKP